MKAEKIRVGNEKGRRAPDYPRAIGEKEIPMGSVPSEDRGDLQRRISMRAFELYVEHGCQDGHDLEDWLEAERQVLSREKRADREVFSGSQA